MSPRRQLPPILFALLACAPAGFATGWDDCRGWEPEHDGKGRWCEIRELTLPPLASLEVDAEPNGGISVEGTDRDDIQVRARVTAWAYDEAEARERAAAVEVRADGGSIRADGPAQGWSVSYRIEVPRRIELDLEANNGGISVHEVEGRMRLVTRNGGLSLAALAGDVRARTVNGGVDVRLRGDRWEGEGLDVETKNGGVRVEVPSGYSAELEAGTINGRVSSDLPGRSASRSRARDLRTTLGNGGARVRARTTNGGVRITRG